MVAKRFLVSKLPNCEQQPHETADLISDFLAPTSTLGLESSSSSFVSQPVNEQGISSHQYMHDKPQMFKVD